MSLTVNEAYAALKEANDYLNKAARMLEIVFEEAPTTEPYKEAKRAAATSYPFLLDAIDIVKAEVTAQRVREGK